MLLAIIYVVILVIWAALGVWSTRDNRDYVALGGGALPWFLFVIIGYILFANKF